MAHYPDGKREIRPGHLVECRKRVDQWVVADVRGSRVVIHHDVFPPIQVDTDARDLRFVASRSLAAA